MEKGRYSLSSDIASSGTARTPGERRRIDWESMVNAQRAQPQGSGRSSWRGTPLSKAEKAGVLGMVAIVVLIAGLVITSGGGSDSNALSPDSEASKVKWALQQQNSPENVTPVPEPAGSSADREAELDELFKTEFAKTKLMVKNPPAASKKGATRKTAANGGSEDQRKKSPARKKSATSKKKPYRTYVIKKNDVLSRISQRFLGTCTRWKEIQKLNPKIDPNHLKPGTKIKLPHR
jgi:LysM repeat protein